MTSFDDYRNLLLFVRARFTEERNCAIQCRIEVEGRSPMFVTSKRTRNSNRDRLSSETMESGLETGKGDVLCRRKIITIHTNCATASRQTSVA